MLLALFSPFLSRIKLITAASPSSAFASFISPAPSSSLLILRLIGLSEVPTSKGTCYPTQMKEWGRPVRNMCTLFYIKNPSPVSQIHRYELCSSAAVIVITATQSDELGRGKQTLLISTLQSKDIRSRSYLWDNLAA